MVANETSAAGPWLGEAELGVDPTQGPTWYTSVLRRAAVTGRAPHTFVAHGERSDLDIEPFKDDGWTVIGSSRFDQSCSYLLERDGALLTVAFRGVAVDLYGAAPTAEQRDQTASEVRILLPSSFQEDEVDVAFVHHHNNHGVVSRYRKVRARSWKEAMASYPGAALESLGALMAVDGEPSGRIVLLHGPPGTGKTSALLTLAREWREWCGFQFVIDPEKLFAGDADYIAQVALEAEQGRWTMLVVEDAADLVRPSTGGRMHPGLARLLNLTDGALGQGLRVLVCITTNEPIGSLHEAIRRPGRCLADLSLGPLSAAEASELLGRPVRQPMPLADVLAARGDLQVLSVDTPTKEVGNYL